MILRYTSKMIRDYFIILVALLSTLKSTTSAPPNNNFKQHPDNCHPLIIAHRGASGYVPEHTLGSYALAITMGADYVEPDLVMTSDGHLISRHENEISSTTDVALHPEFLSRKTNKTIDGKTLTGWFTEDFTLAEIKTLRAIERIPQTRPGNARMDKSFQILTLQEIIDLVKGMQISQQRIIGIYPEIKHSTYFRRLGLPMEQLVVDTLHRNGYEGPEAPIYIQSFEVSNLKELRNMTELRLLQLLESEVTKQPFDQVVLGTTLTYGDMASAGGLQKVARYAYAVSPDKSLIIPRDSNNRLLEATSFVSDAHAAGLKVHPYTFRAENTFLPQEFRSENNLNTGIGDLAGEVQAFLAAGIDGLFTEQPDIVLRLRGPCL